MVYQDHQWHHLRSVVVGSFVYTLADLVVPASHFDYFFARWQEYFRNLYRLIQETARIAAKVQDQLSHSTLLQSCDRSRQLFVSLA